MAIREGEAIVGGKYRITMLLGEGGTARVWLAEEPGFGGRLVAIKELRREALTPEEVEEWNRRFHIEIEMAKQLEQARVPHVIRGLTMEQLEDGSRLLVMEYAEGGSLADRIAKHSEGMPLEDAIRIALEVLQALDAFHRFPSMPVHRDIKPSNILFDDQDRPYLADFGFCQLSGMSSRTRGQGEPHPGTPLYMAPEQAASPEPLTEAADIFALGCMLFEMLTGKPCKRVKPSTKAGSLRREAPAWLDAVLAKVLHPDPWERFGTAGEFATALRERRA